MEGTSMDKYDNKTLDAQIDMILEIAKQRSEIIKSLKQAVLKGDIDEIKKYSKLICGKSDENNFQKLNDLGLPEKDL
jgi:hypothetical protein